MERSTLLKVSGLGLMAMATCGVTPTGAAADKPNILVVMTDQQYGDGMSCVQGKKYLNTPNMDSLAENGMRFTRAYSPNPLCMPMRTCMMTGHYPHQTGVQANGKGKGKANLESFTFMGKIFKDAGYETAYFGKWHVSMKKKAVHGFDTFVEKKASLSPAPAAEFLRQKHDRPLFTFVSFLGPHEICQWARKQDVPGDQLGSIPPVDKRPPMMPNSEPPKNETDVMAHMRKSYQAHPLFPVGNYTEDDWRRQIWGYFRLIERVDGYVGTVMKALRDSGQEDNTVVIFLSDHGDCHGAHHWNQKTVFYDESARVPFIVSWKGKTPKGTSDLLVNVGIDMIPTLCDFAGITPPTDLPGKSMKAPALGAKPAWKRTYVVSQNHMIQCKPVDGLDIKPQGRMVRSDQFKYCVYSEGQQRESLVDMKADPGEMVNQATNPEYASVLKRHRAYLKEHADRYKDKVALEILNSLK